MRRVLVIALVLVLALAGAQAVSATDAGFVAACVQRTGSRDSVGDLNVRLKTACATGQHPLDLATFPVQAAQGPPGPKGERGPRGAKGEQGPAGIVETQLVTRKSATNVNAPKQLRAFCPRGTLLTGGGYSTSILSTDLVLRESTPKGNSWLVNVTENGLAGNIAWSLSVHAICARR